MAHVDEVEIMIHTFYLVPIRSIIVCPPSIPLSSCPPPAPQINTNQTHQHICRIVAPTYPYRWANNKCRIINIYACSSILFDHTNIFSSLCPFGFGHALYVRDILSSWFLHKLLVKVSVCACWMSLMYCVILKKITSRVNANFLFPEFRFFVRWFDLESIPRVGREEVDLESAIRVGREEAGFCSVYAPRARPPAGQRAASAEREQS